MGDNPYELAPGAGRGSSGPLATREKKHPPRHYTEEEIEDLLRNYREVPEAMWDKIPVGTHIRLRKKDGKFIRGGFVQMHWTDKDGQNPIIYVETSLYRNSSGYFRFPMRHDKLAQVWKKDTEKNTMVMQIDFAEVIAKVVERIDRLERDLGRMASIVDTLTRTLGARA